MTLNRAIITSNVVLTILVLWNHTQITFWQYNSVPTWTIHNENSELFRKITDLLIIGLSTFHLIDIFVGHRIWDNLHKNKLLNLLLILLFTVLTFPYIHHWFSYYLSQFPITSIYMLRSSIYLLLSFSWAISLIRKSQNLNYKW